MDARLLSVSQFAARAGVSRARVLQLLAARRIAVLACGAAKAPVIRDVFGSSPNPTRLPAQLLDGASGHVVWILDRPAAQQILPAQDSGDSAPAW